MSLVEKKCKVDYKIGFKEVPKIGTKSGLQIHLTSIHQNVFHSHSEGYVERTKKLAFSKFKIIQPVTQSSCKDLQ